MFLKEDTTIVCGGYKDIRRYNAEYDTQEQHAHSDYYIANVLSNTNTNTVYDISDVNDISADVSDREMITNKCLFYTIFFGFIGYLVYYIFKDAI